MMLLVNSVYWIYCVAGLNIHTITSEISQILSQLAQNGVHCVALICNYWSKDRLQLSPVMPLLYIWWTFFFTILISYMTLQVLFKLQFIAVCNLMHSYTLPNNVHFVILWPAVFLLAFSYTCIHVMDSSDLEHFKVNLDNYYNFVT